VKWIGSIDGPVRFIERTHRSEEIKNLFLQNPILFFYLISKEDFKNSSPFDSNNFSKMLIKNSILKKKIDPKLYSSIKTTCFLIFPKNVSIPITPNLIKWTNNLTVNLLFVKCGVRYYSSLISHEMSKKGIDNLIIIIQTITNILGKVNIIIDKINGVICRTFLKVTPKIT